MNAIDRIGAMTDSGLMVVGVIETVICGEIGYFAKCFSCGWASVGSSKESVAVARGKKHVCMTRDESHP
jgi:hypothetical protein